MHGVGYVPCTKFVRHVVEEEELVFQLCHHSEKLALAFHPILSGGGGIWLPRNNTVVFWHIDTNYIFCRKVGIFKKQLCQSK
jgi:hypothetical protein